MFKEGLAHCSKPGRSRSRQGLQAQEPAELVRLKMKSTDRRRVMATGDFMTGRETHSRQEEGLMAENGVGVGGKGGQTADRGGVSED